VLGRKIAFIFIKKLIGKEKNAMSNVVLRIFDLKTTVRVVAARVRLGVILY